MQFFQLIFYCLLELNYIGALTQDDRADIMVEIFENMKNVSEVVITNTETVMADLLMKANNFSISETTVELKIPSKLKERGGSKKPNIHSKPEMTEAVPKSHRKKKSRDGKTENKNAEKMKNTEATEENMKNEVEKEEEKAEERILEEEEEEYKTKKIEENIDLSEDYEYLDMENEILVMEEEERQRKYRNLRLEVDANGRPKVPNLFKKKRRPARPNIVQRYWKQRLERAPKPSAQTSGDKNKGKQPYSRRRAAGQPNGARIAKAVKTTTESNSKANDDMGLEIGALMALSSMPFTKESPGKEEVFEEDSITAAKSAAKKANLDIPISTPAETPYVPSFKHFPSQAVPVHSLPPSNKYFGHEDHIPGIGATPGPELGNGFEAVGITPGSDQPQGLGSFPDSPTTLFFGDIPVHSRGEPGDQPLTIAALHQIAGHGPEPRELSLHHSVQNQLDHPKIDQHSSEAPSELTTPFSYSPLVDSNSVSTTPSSFATQGGFQTSSFNYKDLSYNPYSGFQYPSYQQNPQYSNYPYPYPASSYNPHPEVPPSLHFSELVTNPHPTTTTRRTTASTSRTFPPYVSSTTIRSTTLNSDEHVAVSSLPYRPTPVPHHPTYERTTSVPTHFASLPLRQHSQGYSPKLEYGSVHQTVNSNPFIGPVPNFREASHSPSLHLSLENEIAPFSPKPDHALPHQQVVLDNLLPHPHAGLDHHLAKEDLPPIPRPTPQPALFTPTPQPSHDPSFGGYQYTTRHSYVKVQRGSNFDISGGVPYPFSDDQSYPKISTQHPLISIPTPLPHHARTEHVVQPLQALHFDAEVQPPLDSHQIPHHSASSTHPPPLPSYQHHNQEPIGVLHFPAIPPQDHDSNLPVQDLSLLPLHSPILHETQNHQPTVSSLPVQHSPSLPPIDSSHPHHSAYLPPKYHHHPTQTPHVAHHSTSLPLRVNHHPTQDPHEANHLTSLPLQVDHNPTQAPHLAHHSTSLPLQFGQNPTQAPHVAHHSTSLPLRDSHNPTQAPHVAHHSTSLPLQDSHNPTQAPHKVAHHSTSLPLRVGRQPLHAASTPFPILHHTETEPPPPHVPTLPPFPHHLHPSPFPPPIPNNIDHSTIVPIKKPKSIQQSSPPKVIVSQLPKQVSTSKPKLTTVKPTITRTPVPIIVHSTPPPRPSNPPPNPTVTSSLPPRAVTSTLPPLQYSTAGPPNPFTSAAFENPYKTTPSPTYATRRPKPTEVHVPPYTEAISSKEQLGKVLNQFIDKISPTQEAEKSLTLGKVLTDFVEISDKALTKQEEENAFKKAQLGQVLNNFKRKTGGAQKRVQLIGPIAVKANGPSSFSLVHSNNPVHVQTFVIDGPENVRHEKSVTGFFSTKRPSIHFDTDAESHLSTSKKSDEGVKRQENIFQSQTTPRPESRSNSPISQEYTRDKKSLKSQSTGKSRSIRFEEPNKKDVPLNVRFPDRRR